MYSLLQLREHLNCSHQELGEFVLLNRYVINNAESGRRPLPLDAVEAFLALRRRCLDKDKHAPGTSDGDPTGQEELKQNAALRISECQATIAAKLRELDRLTSQYAESTRALSYITWILEHPGDLTEKQIDWLRYRRDLENVRLKKVGLAAQREVEVKISLLQHEISIRSQDI